MTDAVGWVIEALEARTLLSISVDSFANQVVDVGTELQMPLGFNRGDSLPADSYNVDVYWDTWNATLQGDAAHDSYSVDVPANQSEGQIDLPHTFYDTGEYAVRVHVTGPTDAGEGEPIYDAWGDAVVVVQTPTVPTDPATDLMLGAHETRMVSGGAFDLQVHYSNPAHTGSIHVDWGDGSDPDNDNVTGEEVANYVSDASISHVYAHPGQYTISASTPDSSASGLSFDSGFGTGGEVSAPLSTSAPRAMAALGDGKFATIAGEGNSFRVKAYDAGGNLNWSTAISFASYIDDWAPATPSAIAVQDDGRIVIAGDIEDISGYRFAVARLNADGSIDTSFGTEGMAVTSFAAYDARANALAINSSTGSITLAGFAGGNVALARYDASGSPDEGFGTNGKLAIDLGSAADIAYGLTLDSAGGLIVTGRKSSNMAVVRLLASGAADTLFGDSHNGQEVIDVNGLGYAYSAALDSQGRIVVAGEITPGDSDAQLALVRLTATGQLDLSFNHTGKWITSYYHVPGYLRSVAITNSDQIVFSGGITGNEHGAVIVGRLNSDGSFDSSFATGGLATRKLPENSPGDAWASTLLETGGRIIAGEAINGAPGNFFRMWGMLPTNVLSVVGTPPTLTLISDESNSPNPVEGLNYRIHFSASTGSTIEPVTCWVIHAGDKDISVSGNPSYVDVPLPAGSYTITVEAIGLSGDRYALASGGGIAVDAADAPSLPLTSTAISSSRIDLSWTAISGAINYRVQRSDDGGQSFVNLTESPITATSYSDTTGMGRNLRYLYRVYPADASGQSLAKYDGEAVTDFAAPTGLTALQSTDHAAHLTWMAMGGLGGYIERAAAQNGPYTKLTLIGAGQSEWDDTTIQPVGNYYYQLAGYNEKRVGAQVHLTAALLPAPGNVRARRSGSNDVISWDAVAGATKYRVYWATSTSTLWTAWQSDLTETNLTSNISGGNTHYYFVVAIKTVGSSDFLSLRSAVRAVAVSGVPALPPSSLPAPQFPGGSITGPGTGEDWDSGSDVAPAAPANVTATPSAENESASIHVSWDEVDGALAYYVYRRVGAETDANPDEFDADPYKIFTDELSFDDYSVSPGLPYVYDVAAVVEGLESQVVSSVPVTVEQEGNGQPVLPSGPSEIRLGATKDSQGNLGIVVNWDPVEGAVDYTVKWGHWDFGTEPDDPGVWVDDDEQENIDKPGFEIFGQIWPTESVNVIANYGNGITSDSADPQDGNASPNGNWKPSASIGEGWDGGTGLMNLVMDTANVSSGEPTPEQQLANGPDIGKVIVVNDADSDSDGGPNFADAFSNDISGRYVPLLLQALRPGDTAYDFDDLRIRFNYSGSAFDEGTDGNGGQYSAYAPAPGEDDVDYSGISLHQPKGALRIWGDVDGSPLYIIPNHDYTLAELGIEDNEDVQTSHFYVEAVRPSQAVGDLSITATLHDGDHKMWQQGVKLTAVQAIAPDAAYSGAVRLSDGAVHLTFDELSTGGYGLPWGETRVFDSSVLYGLDPFAGRNIEIAQMPHLIQATSEIIAFVGGQPTFFDHSNGGYVARFGVKQTLVQETDGTWTLADDAGNRITFNDFDPGMPVAARGSMIKFTDADGDVAQVMSTLLDGHIAEIQRGGAGGESYVYQYQNSTLTGVTIRRKVDGGWLDVRHVDYVYGSEGSAIVKDGSGFSPALGGSDPSNKYKLKAFSYHIDYLSGKPQMAWVVYPDASARNAGLLAFSPSYGFQYFGDDDPATAGRVQYQHVLGAGAAASPDASTIADYQYDYQTDGDGMTGINAWRTKTSVAMPSGATENAYTDFAGLMVLDQELLSWNTLTRYDNNGLPLFVTQPSAVIASAPDYTKADLGADSALLHDDSGLINGLTYTTEGYVSDRYVKHGRSGSNVVLEHFDYLSHSASGGLQHVVQYDTLYPGPGTANQRKTEYVYDFDGLHIKSITTNLPKVSTSQNGKDLQQSTVERYDLKGRLESETDADGFTASYGYDETTGAVISTRQAVGNGKPDITTSVTKVDKLGRPLESKDGRGLTTTYAYEDAGDHSRTTVVPPLGPVSISYTNYNQGYSEQRTEVSLGDHTLLSLSRSYFDYGGRVIWADRYPLVSGTAFNNTYHEDQATAPGVLNTNYYRTSYAYNSAGLQSDVISAAGTITHTEYDLQDRPIAISIGTNSTNRTTTQEMEYDGGNNAVGDGNLTKITYHPGTGDFATANWYDWRDRMVASIQGADPASADFEDVNTNRPLTFNVLDNLGEVTTTDIYDGDGITPTITDGEPALELEDSRYLFSESTTDYDSLGRAFRTTRHSVTPGTGAVGEDGLTTKVFYDGRGNVIENDDPSGIVTKARFDGAGRKTIFSTGSKSQPLVQVETEYDGDENPILLTSTQWNSIGNKRVSYVLNAYDSANRPTDTLDFGTNGGVKPAQFSTPAAMKTNYPSAYYSSNIFSYIAIASYTGLFVQSTDPRGVQTHTQFDALGRVIQKVDGYVDGAASTGDDDITNFTYTPLNQIKTQTVYKATSSGVKPMTTTYYYGVSISGGSKIESQDLLLSVLYPRSTGSTTLADQETYSYDALGRVINKVERSKDQHAYVYDPMGHMISDTASSFQSGMDQSNDRHTFTFNALGQLTLATTWSATSISNQVQRDYDGLGNLITEWQSHSWGVVTSGPNATPHVGYCYDDPAHPNRLTSIIYPNQRALTYVYVPGIDDQVGRVSYLTDGNSNASPKVEQYSYLGLSQVVNRTRPEPNLSEAVSSDAFGRTAEVNWSGPHNSTIERDQYGYDADSNLLYKLDLNGANSPYSEIYQPNGAAASAAYDQLGRETGFRRGIMSASNVISDSYTNLQQSWSVDSTGNLRRDSAVAPDIQRPVIQDIPSDSDAKTKLDTLINSSPLTPDPSNAITATFDAWGNLTALRQWSVTWNVHQNDPDTVATITPLSPIWGYYYDALGRRIGDSGIDVYYGANGNAIQENNGSTVSAQYVWAPDGELLMRDRDAATGGNLGKTASGLDERLYAIDDGRGNVTAIISSTGLVSERYNYTPDGKMTITSPFGIAITNSAFNWQYTFQTGRRDGDGIYRLRSGQEWDYLTGQPLAQDPRAYDNNRDIHSAQTINDAPVEMSTAMQWTQRGLMVGGLALAGTEGEAIYLVGTALVGALVGAGAAKITGHDVSDWAGRGWDIGSFVGSFPGVVRGGIAFVNRGAIAVESQLLRAGNAIERDFIEGGRVLAGTWRGPGGAAFATGGVDTFAGEEAAALAAGGSAGWGGANVNWGGLFGNAVFAILGGDRMGVRDFGGSFSAQIRPARREEMGQSANWNLGRQRDWKDLIMGRAQKTGTDGHRFRIYREAIQMAKSGRYQQIYLDRTWESATGFSGKVFQRRPDIIGVLSTGKVEAIEVMSRTDVSSILYTRMNDVMKLLPESARTPPQVILYPY